MDFIAGEEEVAHFLHLNFCLLYVRYLKRVLRRISVRVPIGMLAIKTFKD